MFSSLHLAVDLHVVTDDIERARDGCFVARSLRCSVDVTAEVKGS